ncbi:MAG: phenylacetate--CoA ligase family protein, partial [Methanoculleus sp.]
MIRLGKRICSRESFTVKALGILPSINTYMKTYALLRRSWRWSREEHAAYQAEALSHLLDHAYENVPYYRRIFDDRGLVPGDIRTPADLRLLPLLSRED